MKIFGIGTDIINIKRMEKTLKKDGSNFKKRVFSENEIPLLNLDKIEGLNIKRELLLSDNEF